MVGVEDNSAQVKVSGLGDEVCLCQQKIVDIET